MPRLIGRWLSASAVEPIYYSAVIVRAGASAGSPDVKDGEDGDGEGRQPYCGTEGHEHRG